MRVGDRGGLVVAGLGEPLGGEQPDRLQQPVPQGSPGGLGHRQALVHQRPEQARDIQRVDAAGPAHPPRRRVLAARPELPANTDRRASSTCSAPVSSE